MIMMRVKGMYMSNIIVVLIFDEYKLTSESNGLND